MTLDELLERGFNEVARWRRQADGAVAYDGEVPGEPGLYLFVSARCVRYVGSALGRLRSRMNSHRRMQRDTADRRCVHDGLADAIGRGEAVAIHSTMAWFRTKAVFG